MKYFIKGVFLILIFSMLSGCTSTKISSTGYKTKTLLLYGIIPIHDVNSPFLYCGNDYFKSDDFVTILNSTVIVRNESGSPVKIASVSRLVGSDGRNDSVSNPLTCNASLLLVDNSVQNGKLTLRVVNEKASASWVSDNDEFKSRLKAIQEKKDAEIKFNSQFPNDDYPYMAYLSCSIMGRNVSLVACLSDSSGGTSLEIQNGDYYHLYRMYDISNLGRVGNDGATEIPLRNKFSIKGQNSSDSMNLNLIIKDRSNGKVLFQKSASMYGFISVMN